MTAILKLWGHVIHRWKGIFKTYLAVYYKPPNFQNYSRKNKKQIRSCLVTADQGGQKNRNGKTTAVLFYHVFY
jgi:hypothetical protein